jgi:hypothetical protein
VTRREVEVLLEAATAAYRERRADHRILPAPAWQDLPAEAREELFRRQVAASALERATHPRGWSGTVQAVLTRILNS